MPMYPRQPLDHIHTPLQRQSPRIDPVRRVYPASGTLCPLVTQVAPHPSKVVMDAEEFVSSKLIVANQAR